MLMFQLYSVVKSQRFISGCTTAGIHTATITVQGQTFPRWILLLAKCRQDCWGREHIHTCTWRKCDPSHHEGSIAVSVVEHVTMCVQKGGMSGYPE